MDDPLVGKIVLQLFLILLNALFASAEMAIISVNDNKLARLAATGDKRAAKLLLLTDQPSKFLATIQIGITFAGFLGSAFAADNFADKLILVLASINISIPRSLSVIVITIILSYLTLVLGELVPKRIGMRKAEPLALIYSGPIYFISKIFAPVVWFLTASTNIILRLVGIDPDSPDGNEVTEEEIRMMIDVGSEKGAIDHVEKTFIHNVFEFDNKTADEVMTHRTDAALLWLEESDEKWEKIIVETRHSTYPICEASSDNIVGVLKLKDYFMLKNRSRANIVNTILKPVQFVPETVRTDVLFNNMQKNRDHFAVVLDEFGGMSGVITINDLLEQLVGDLEDDEYAPEDILPIEKIFDNVWIVSGSAPIEKVSEEIGIKLPEDDYEFFAGMLFGMLGTIPPDGTTPEIFEFGLVMKALEIKDHRLEKAVICKINIVNEVNSKDKKDNKSKDRN